MNKSYKNYNRYISWKLAILLFLIPLFFLPITTNFYDFNKNFLLFLGAGLLLLAWGIKIAVEKEIKLVRTPFDLLILLFTLSLILATIFASPNKVEAFLTPGATGTIIILTLLYFLIANTPGSAHHIQYAIIASASLLTLIAIYQFFGLGEVLIAETSKLAFMRAKFWTPAGDLLSLLVFLLIVLPQALTLSLKTFKENPLRGSLLGLFVILIASGAVIAIFQLLPGKPTSLLLLPYPSAWAIAVEAFKQNPLFGVGPGNFVSAFNRFRPVDFNRFDFWNLRFGAGSSYPLHLLTETGILGVGAFAIIVITIIKIIKAIKNPAGWGLLTCVAFFFLLPGNFLLLFAFFVLLAMVTPKKDWLDLKIGEKIRWLPLTGMVLILAPLFYLGGKAYAAEIYFKKSLDALAQNRGLDTYNNQIKAITLNPRRVDFRLVYSQTNFALANSIATNPPSGQLTDQDRNNITQLIQQAIREARAATVLNPTNSTNWENLAQLYRNLLNFAQGADQWTIAAYQQAVATDPISPRLRVDLGGLFYALGNYDEAQKIFRIAVELKPDYANGWYNLAAAYREDKKYQQAYQAMQQTLALVPTDSADWQRAKEELDELAKKLPSPTPTPTGTQPEKQQEELSKPQPLPSPVVQPPIELPEESTPSSQP